MELPRLQLRFEPRVDSEGRCRLYSLDYDGMIVSLLRCLLAWPVVSLLRLCGCVPTDMCRSASVFAKGIVADVFCCCRRLVHCGAA